MPGNVKIDRRDRERNMRRKKKERKKQATEEYQYVLYSILRKRVYEILLEYG